MALVKDLWFELFNWFQLTCDSTLEMNWVSPQNSQGPNSHLS